jgi:catechol 2,3-dioxygenase-like lactoylglutathione lyase family enzyme
MFRGIHHTALSTPDFDRALRFYRDMIGLEECTGFDWPVGSHGLDKIVGLNGSSGRAVMLKAGNAMIEIFEYATPEPTPADPNRRACDHGLTHICFDIVDLDAEYERMSTAGVVFHTKPRLVANGGAKITYARDPDGNILELQEVLNMQDPVVLDWMR